MQFVQNNNQNNPYGYIVSQILPNVLGNLMRNGIINQDIANRINGTQNNWMPNFMQQVPNGVQPHQMEQILGTFITQLINQGVFNPPQQNQWNNNTGWNIQGGSMGHQNSFTMNNNQPQAPRNVFGKQEDKVEYKPQVEQPNNNSYVPEVIDVNDNSPYEPEWCADKGLLTTNAYDYGDISVNSFAFPSDSREDTNYLYAIVFPYVLATKHRMFELLDVIAGKAKKYVATVDHMETLVINLSNKEVITHLNNIKELINKGGSNLSKFKLIMEYLDSKPRGVFIAFEHMFTDLFNEALVGRVMHTSDNFGKRLTITSMDSINVFAPGNGAASIDLITSTPNYPDMYNTVLGYMFKYICNYEPTKDIDVIKDALYTASGEDAIKAYAECIDGDDKTDSLTVLVNKNKTIITNFDLNKSLTYRGLNEERSGVLAEVCTSALDLHLKSILSNRSRPIRVVSTCGEEFHISWTSDHQLIYSR